MNKEHLKISIEVVKQGKQPWAQVALYPSNIGFRRT
jgi:hypothetical protein